GYVELCSYFREVSEVDTGGIDSFERARWRSRSQWSVPRLLCERRFHSFDKRIALPMWSSETLHITAVELVNTLQGDFASLLREDQVGYFLPRFALLTLLADEIDEWFKPTMEGRPTAAF